MGKRYEIPLHAKREERALRARRPFTIRDRSKDDGLEWELDWIACWSECPMLICIQTIAFLAMEQGHSQNALAQI